MNVCHVLGKQHRQKEFRILGDRDRLEHRAKCPKIVLVVFAICVYVYSFFQRGTHGRMAFMPNASPS